MSAHSLEEELRRGPFSPEVTRNLILSSNNRSDHTPFLVQSIQRPLLVYLRFYTDNRATEWDPPPEGRYPYTDLIPATPYSRTLEAVTMNYHQAFALKDVNFTLWNELRPCFSLGQTQAELWQCRDGAGPIDIHFLENFHWESLNASIPATVGPPLRWPNVMVRLEELRDVLEHLKDCNPYPEQELQELMPRFWGVLGHVRPRNYLILIDRKAMGDTSQLKSDDIPADKHLKWEARVRRSLLSLDVWGKVATDIMGLEDITDMSVEEREDLEFVHRVVPLASWPIMPKIVRWRLKNVIPSQIDFRHPPLPTLEQVMCKLELDVGLTEAEWEEEERRERERREARENEEEFSFYS